MNDISEIKKLKTQAEKDILEVINTLEDKIKHRIVKGMVNINQQNGHLECSLAIDVFDNVPPPVSKLQVIPSGPQGRA